MEPGWQMVYSTNMQHQAEIIKAVLKDHLIECVSIDKRDSSYVNIGEIELYTKAGDAILARFLIEQHQL